MSDYKEFEGKSLDTAIAEACAYYDAPREKLEIDIVQDAKTGIFGIVGARKAIVRARRAMWPEIGKKDDEKAPKKGRSKSASPDLESSSSMEEAQNSMNAPAEDTDTPQNKVEEAPAKGRKTKKAASEAAENKDRQERDTAKKPAPRAGKAPVADAADSDAPGDAEASSKEKRGRRPAADKGAARPPRGGEHEFSGDDTENQEYSLPRPALSDLDQAKLLQTSRDVINSLIKDIVDDVSIEVRVGDDRVLVQINGEDTGLLIGREGQNLAAVQYLAARIISRFMEAQVRVQVDAGDYHSRQDNRLKELAQSLADKVRTTGKSLSTKPLSAYQRRVIHLCLQDDPDIYTRSSGEGALKRVVVMRRKENQ